MEYQDHKKKPKRKNRGNRQGQGGSPQQPMPHEPHPSDSRRKPSLERRPEPPKHHPRPDNEGTSQVLETGLGSGKNHPRPGASSAEQPKDPGQIGYFTPPLQQTSRFRGPSPSHVFQRAPQSGGPPPPQFFQRAPQPVGPPPPQVFQRAPQAVEQQSFWGPRPGQARSGGPPPRPPFSLPSQQGAQLETPVIRPHEPQQPAVRAWDLKSTTSDAAPQHPEPGAAGPKPQQKAKKAKGQKNKRGDSQQLKARDDPQPCVSHDPGRMSTERRIQDSRSGNVWHKTSDQPGSSKKPVDSKEKQGIGDKPLHESLKKALVLESSTEKSDNETMAKSEETGRGQTSVQEPPKRRGILKHSAKYFESETGHLVEVNYLRIDVKSMKFKIFQYEVDFEPKNPKYLYRHALKLFLEQEKINRCPAFDGKTLLFAGGTELKFPNGLKSFHGSVKFTDGSNSVEFCITIQFTRELNLQTLLEYMRNGSSMNRYDTQALDLVLMNDPINRSLDLIKVGRSFYTRPANPISLGDRQDLWFGHYQSVVIPWLDTTQERQHLYLNVDVAHKGFISNEIKVVEYVTQEFFAGEGIRSNSSLLRGQLEKAEQFLRSLKIDYQVPNQRKIAFKVVSLGAGARSARFKPDDQNETTVEAYFQNSKNLRLKYFNLPCLKDSRGRMYPMEFCSIPSQAVNKQLEPNQSRVMVRVSARRTYERKQQIMESIGNLDFANDPCLKEFGLTLNTSFETVNAYVLEPPSIQYQKETVSVRDGKWNNDQFIKPVNLSEWVLINTDRFVRDFHIRGVVDNFKSAGLTCGVTVSDPSIPKLDDLERRLFVEEDFVKIFKEWKAKGATFFMVIMNTKINRIYNYIKRAAELEIYGVGVLTQCIKSDTITRQIQNRSDSFRMTARNILLKLNAKISGVNHSLAAQFRPEILAEDVMIVGADVTHPSPGSKELSIAAVAASHDEYGFQYNMDYRLQRPKVEVIVELKDMITKQIEFYQKKNNGKIPKRILYYRDGVGESYFGKVVEIELTAIKQACSEFGAPFRTTITFIVVQKRHHTRFFPSKKNSDGPPNQNVRPGTIVDEKITHPTEVDFFLVSHKSLKGTARPTKYHLLYDDNSPVIDQETLERVTYYLCHMFARCNRSVSYPAPTYYAHLAAFRAKAWWSQQPYEVERLEQNQREKGQLRDDVVTAMPMFFI